MFWEIFEIVSAVCLVSDFISVPLCRPGDWLEGSIDMKNPSQTLKERLKALPDDVRVEIPDGSLDQAEVESIMASVTPVLRAYATGGPDAMTAEEVEIYLDGLFAPIPTTMVTVAASTPTN